MLWFGSNKNGEHNTHNKPRSGELDHVHRPVIIHKPRSGELGHVHRPVIIDQNGVKHPIVGIDYESHNSEQYVAKTEKVVEYRRFPGMADGEYISSRTGDLSGRKDEFSTKSHDERVHGPVKDSPWDNRFRFNSPPPKDHRHTTHGDEHHNVRVNNPKGMRPDNMRDREYEADEKNKRNGFTNQGSRPNYLRDQEDYYENVNPKTNGYSPPKYSVPVSTHQGDKEKGNNYATRARVGPFGTPPRDETSNFKPVAYSPPLFNPQPKKEQGNYNQETIDSNEARKRYGKGVAGAGPGLYGEGQYSGTIIDSREAAKKYNGVLLTN